MATIEEMIKNSVCFGVAYDGSVKECKICEVRTKCKSKCECGVGELPKKPTSVALADKEEVSNTDKAIDISRAKENSPSAKKPTKSKKKVDVQYSDDMPDFKKMSMEEVENLLVERGGDLKDFEKYTNASIRKMRLTMFLKSTYEVK